MKKKKLSFKQARIVSDCIYALAAIVLLYKIFYSDVLSAAQSNLVITAALGLFVIAFVIYSIGCKCPKCGKVQPRYSKTECVDCKTKLN